jgi:hypothetical protein
LLSGRPPIPEEWMPQQHGTSSSRGGSSNVTSPKRGRGAGGYSPQKRQMTSEKLSWLQRQNERKLQIEEERYNDLMHNDEIFDQLLQCRQKIYQKEEEDKFRVRAQEQSYLEEKQKRKQRKGYQNFKIFYIFFQLLR